MFAARARDVLQVDAFERPHDYAEHCAERYGPTLAAHANARKDELLRVGDELTDDFNLGTSDDARFEMEVPARRRDAGLAGGRSIVVVEHGLASELAAMAAEDQRIRTMPGDGMFARRLTLQQRIESQRVDVANTDRLRAIVAEFGWPGSALVGEQGAEHAWLLAQHADRQLDSQRLFLAALETAVGAGDAPTRHVAYLTDRVAMNEGRPQTYGTQIASVEDGEGLPWPIADRETLDERRASAGLPGFSEYVAHWRGLT